MGDSLQQLLQQQLADFMECVNAKFEGLSQKVDTLLQRLPTSQVLRNILTSMVSCLGSPVHCQDSH